jgi:5,5'-dehydrodivanillate O-demethylase
MNKSDNERMTRVGPGTPCGEMLRRYWWPIGVSENVGKAPVPVRLLGEDLVLFRAGNGTLGLLDRRCSHRGASLEFGRVEERGIRCCYHGWLYDHKGKCLEQPCEPPTSTYKNEIQHKAYRVREASGLVFAYIGPDPMPEFPKYDLLTRSDLDKVVMGRDAHCNWFQRAENMLDALHVLCLHSTLYPELAMQRPDRTEYLEKWYGFQIELDYPNGTRDRHHVMFPSANRIQIARAGQQSFQFLQWCVPIDDTESMFYQIWASEPKEGKGSIKAAKYQKTVPGEYKRVEDGWWNIWERDQDDAAVDSQGRIADRSNEHLGTCDLGLVKFRKMVAQSIKAVESGKDPVGVIRAGDGNDGFIDLHSWKTELDVKPGQVRAPEVGAKIGIIAPHDF